MASTRIILIIIIIIITYTTPRRKMTHKNKQLPMYVRKHVPNDPKKNNNQPCELRRTPFWQLVQGDAIGRDQGDKGPGAQCPRMSNMGPPGPISKMAQQWQHTKTGFIETGASWATLSRRRIRLGPRWLGARRARPTHVEYVLRGQFYGSKLFPNDTQKTNSQHCLLRRTQVWQCSQWDAIDWDQDDRGIARPTHVENVPPSQWM